MNKKILVSGGDGLLARELLKANVCFDMALLSRKEMDVTDPEQIIKQISLHKPDLFLHCAAQTHPMENHKTNPATSIKNNIIGTSNVAHCCLVEGVKMVYTSTEWVYSNKENNVEGDTLLPTTNYGWSKLGGECAVQMLPDHLILRCSFTARPYKFDRAFTDVRKSYLYVDKAAQFIMKLLEKDCSGVYNIGGKSRTTYEFAKESNPSVGKIRRKEVGTWIPNKCTMNNKKMMLEVESEFSKR